jgi:cell division protein ZapA (FtsZ GTPase activity inhibitor)
MEMAQMTEQMMDRVKELVHENRRITIREVANMLGIFIWVSSEHSERQSEYLSHCRQIRAPPTTWR